ncbi:hypothetical protein SERLA73DRAFT_74243 [Serpula lacrymans var. lacrymans S7.3]|uniref:3-beta hydroxysteroid dehydrogenase/isomerase domain-containing protein n=2 Tax=Serpula lacrymans var. lacrymans TaxID=341189 RepID=F8Q104_SERL3|nr:uncharacterized protein SERLADRAFT_438896 [Serpula lacrymans var. lacrymans S7.9]EGN97982.1 hypothetical protein SERLA73DRAFT_74243 [Serpula lacrymans var. lacrymans S7.3]EGO23573.1 hypothetical protein SERLADRAFT_438896 [Serpula lacrymans var. lacrymans S7.9]
MPSFFSYLLILLSSLYIWSLNKRLKGPALKAPLLTPEQLDKVSYDEIDLTKTVPPATQKGYAVVGGSGFLGTYLVRLLLSRGETNIRVLDLRPPPPEIISNRSVSYVRTDITSAVSVRNALLQPFESTGSPPSVIYHMAVIIRFWERNSFSWPISYGINVVGTKNIIAAAKQISGATLIYTSTADAVLHSAKSCHVGLDASSSSIVVNDNAIPLSSWGCRESNYARSKIISERLIVEANGQKGLKTGIIRPGYTITGPNDRLCTSTLMMPRVPIFGKRFKHTNICAWDAVSAHLLLEDALCRIPEETVGQAFLVTGKSPAWSMRDTREAIRHYSTKPLIFDDVPELAIFFLAHIVEFFIYLRYYILLPIYLLLTSRPPPPEPRWMGESVYLQPATLEFMADITIDDSRARRVLGYQAQWTTEQWIKYTVDEIQSDRNRGGHGLQLKPIE